jgi:hypothetical protein
MNFYLGMTLKNEEEMLTRHLALVSSCFDFAVFLDDGSTDQSEAVIRVNCKCPFEIIKKTDGFTGFADNRNRIIKSVEDRNQGWFKEAMFMLDADECMFPKDIQSIKNMVEAIPAIALPRYEIVEDFKHQNVNIYPDFQARVFQLDRGYEYRNKVHEILCIKDQPLAVSDTDGMFYTKDEHIFHYGRCKSPKFLWTKDNNYNRINQGLPPENIEARDEDCKVEGIWANPLLFDKEQPI